MSRVINRAHSCVLSRVTAHGSLISYLQLW